MKARISLGRLFGMVWAVVAASHVVAQDTPASPATASSDAAGPAAAAPNANTPFHPLPASAADLSPSLKPPLSAGSGEIQSLTQAGVDQRVILAYITNSAARFNLSPDHIIHLKDEGVLPQVIKAMLHHDQALPATAPPLTVPAPPPATLAVPPPAPGEVQVIANDEPWAVEYVVADEGYSVAEQPASAGPIRVPYPVKLNDPIVIFKLPTFTVPCW